MLARFIGCPAAKNAFIHSKMLMTQQHVPVGRVLGSRFLHVKVTDTQAGLSAQREANRFKQQGELRDEQQDIYKGNKNMQFVTQPSQDASNEQNVYKTMTTNLNKAAVIQDTDPDTFGDAPKSELREDEGDKEEEEYISRPTRRIKKLRTIDYARQIKDLLNSHRLKEALEVLEVRMQKEDRVKPESYIYNLLISGCAKAGYTRKAFQLYNKMRKHGLKPKESTYTSLFNACANAPSRLDGLNTATRLRASLLEKGYEPNVKNYNAMIKAFGRWGDVQTAYLLADEMVDKKLDMSLETYNFLLQACASDVELGFRHCLITWHKMLAKGYIPDYYSFNAVLRCVRDCGFGDLESMQKALNNILCDSQNVKLPTTSENPKQLVDRTSNNSSTSMETTASSSDTQTSTLTTSATNAIEIQNDAMSLELPNLLAPQPHLGSMVSLAEVKKPHERFLLLGGINGFLENMKSRNITPDIQTFTTMLEVIPPTIAAEKQLLMFIRKIGLKADIDFFNILIKKRAMRFDYEGGKEVLSMIKTAGLKPDIVTYGVLALGCTTVETSRELLQQMKEKNIRMNIQILGAMLSQACHQRAFRYVCEIMQISLEENIRPNDFFLRHLNKFYLQCARAIDARHPSTKTNLYKKEHRLFCDKYRLYQEEHRIDGLKVSDAINKLRERPYEHYKQEPIEGVEPIKNEKLAKQKKERKYIKKIKLQNLKDDEGTSPNAIAEPNEPRVRQNNPFRISS